jgi:glutamyl-tRNA synthetase
VGSGDGRFDKKKATWVSGEHLRKLDDADLARGVVPFLAQRGLTVAGDDPTLVAAVKTVRTRSSTWIDMAEALDFYFRDPVATDPAAAQKFLNDASRAQLGSLADVLDAVTDFTEANITAAVEAWLTAQGLEIKHVAQPARVALTGKTASPGLYEMLAVLGRDRAVSRLRGA